MHYLRVKDYLEHYIPRCKVSGTRTWFKTGDFDVIDAESGKVYHSRKGGDGLPSPFMMPQLVQKIMNEHGQEMPQPLQKVMEQQQARMQREEQQQRNSRHY